MAVNQPVSPLLLEWSTSLLESFFRTDHYRASPGARQGEPLIDSLSRDLAVGLREMLVRHGIVAGAPAILAAQRDPETSPLHQEADALARICFSTQLHHDLSDVENPRHEMAQVELWVNAREQLEKGSFFGNRTPSFHVLLEEGAKLGEQKEDILDGFWKDVWPVIVIGRQTGKRWRAPADPPFIHAWIQVQANGYCSHTHARYKRSIARIHTDIQAGRRDPGEGGTLIDELSDQEMSAFRMESGRSLEALAEIEIEREERIRDLIDAYRTCSKENRLGLLISIFRREMMPNVSGFNRLAGGKNQQIAMVLEAWQADRSILIPYLTNSTHGLGLDSDLATEIAGIVSPGLDAHESSLTTKEVTDLYRKMRACIQAHEKRRQSQSGHGADDVESEERHG